MEEHEKSPPPSRLAGYPVLGAAVRALSWHGLTDEDLPGGRLALKQAGWVAETLATDFLVALAAAGTDLALVGEEEIPTFRYDPEGTDRKACEETYGPGDEPVLGSGTRVPNGLVIGLLDPEAGAWLAWPEALDAEDGQDDA